MKKLMIIMFAAAIALASACKKDDPEKPSNKTLLTAKPWKPVGMTIGGTDAWGLVDDCDKDNTSTFKSDGTYTEDEGATKCNSGDPQTTTSTWAFINNETQLVYGGDTVIIKTLNATTLVIQQDLLGTPAVATFSNQ